MTGSAAGMQGNQGSSMCKSITCSCMRGSEVRRLAVLYVDGHSSAQLNSVQLHGLAVQISSMLLYIHLCMRSWLSWQSSTPQPSSSLDCCGGASCGKFFLLDAPCLAVCSQTCFIATHPAYVKIPCTCLMVGVRFADGIVGVSLTAMGTQAL